MPRYIVIKGPGYEKVVAELEARNADYQVLEPEDLDEEKLVDELRLLPPQVRGRIRYGKGKPLPLSRRGRLNVINTCILLVYEGGKLVDVYPKMMGRRYIDPVEGVRLSLSGVPLYYLYEEPLLVLLIQHPELVGCARVRSIKERVPLSEGGYAEIDLLLETAEGEPALVEVEERASLGTIAQALSLARAYEKQANEKVERVLIAAIYADEGARRAAAKASVEIWTVKLERIV